MKASSDHISPESRSTRQCGTAQHGKRAGWHLLMGIALFTFFTGYGAGLKAQQSITYKQELDGAAGQLAKDSSRTVMDSVFLNPGSFPAIDSLEPYKVSNIIVFHINETSPRMLPDSFKAELTLRVYFTNGNEVSDSVTEKKLNIDYYKSKPYNNKAVYYFSDARLVTVKVIDITSAYPALSTILPLLKLENRIVISRVFAMDCQNDAIKSVSHSTATVSTKGELKVSWASLNAAQQYDLEWTFIDQSALDAGWYNSGGSLDAEKIFRNNATRVTIHANNYNIPLLYEGNGKLFYRVRAAQTMFDKERKVTLWSSDFVSQGGLGEYVFSGHELSLNWQAATSFAEEGKRKSVVQYFDGTLRNRQTVTKDNTTDTTLVAETFYDKQGRAVIQVLPAPTLSSLISYNPLFNQARVDGAPVENTPGVYDTLKAATGYCAAGAPPLDSVSGASQYYSYNNPNKLNPIHKFIPQAKGFPFTEVKYSQDNTGRIVSQGGVGPQFQLNSGHETKYYYGTPLQTELDALFGTEAGYASHYQKNMVRDANGQYSVSYVDMHGRTVATALAGAAPDSMQALTSFRDSIQTDNLLTPVNNVIKGNTIASTSALLVTKAGVNSFHYSLNAESLQLDDKDAVEICYDCLYDLTITISDDCNNQNLPGDSLFVFHKSNMRVQPPVYDTSCDAAGNFDTTINVALKEGSYLVTKKLTLRQDAMAYYRDSLYTPHNTVRTKEDIITEQLNRIREQRGNDCVQEGQPWYSYQQYHEQMLLDMTPPFGQYARYPNDPNDPRNKGEDYLNLFSIFDKEGNPGVYVYKNIAYTGSYPRSPNEMSPEDFISNFQPQWAEDLVREKHPERCLLREYESYKASHHWDADFEATDTYQQALAKGYLNPTNSANPPASGFGNGNDSLFFTNSGAKSWFNTALLNYKTNAGQTLSLWAMASIVGHCDPEDETCVNSFYNTPSNVFNSSIMGCQGELDMAWRFFRGEYLRLKRGWIDDTIRSACSFPVLEDKAAPVFLDETAATGLAGNLLSIDRPTAQQAAADSLASMAASTCLAYAQSWWRQLAGCNYNATDSAIIIPRLIEVCKQGSDSSHPFGASSVRPESSYTYRSFDEVISQYNIGTGKPNNAACNAYLIDAPGPYNRPVLAVEQPLYTKPDDCTCEKIGALKAQYETASGYSSFSDYIQKTLHTTISQNALDSLLNLCNGNIACRYIAKPITLPPALQCATGYDVCVDCNAVSNVYTSFKASFPGIIPTYEEMSGLQQNNNRLFTSYMNNKLGFSKSAQEYLAFMDTCGVGIVTGCDSLDAMKKSFRDEMYHINYDSDGYDTTTWKADFGSSFNNTGTPHKEIFIDGIAHYPYPIQGSNHIDFDYMFPPIKDSVCLNNNFRIEFRIKNPVPDSVLQYGEELIWLLGDNGNHHFIFRPVSSYWNCFCSFDIPNAPDTCTCSLNNFVRRFDDWRTVKIIAQNNKFDVYLDSIFIQSLDYSYAGAMNKLYGFSTVFSTRNNVPGGIDWIRLYDSTGNLLYNEDFDDPKNFAHISEKQPCNTNDCQASFTNHFNQQKGTSYTYEQVDSVFFNTCGKHLDVCGSNGVYKDSLLNLVSNFYTSYSIADTDTAHFSVAKIFEDDIKIIKDRYHEVFANGMAHISQSFVTGTPYENAELVVIKNDTICVNNEFSIEARFKGDAFDLSGTNPCKTINFIIWDENPQVCFSPTFHMPGVNPNVCGTGTYTCERGFDSTNRSKYFRNLLDWTRLRMTFKDFKVSVYVNDTLIASLPYSIPINKIRRYGVLIGRGYLDYIKIYDASGNLQYSEEFEDCLQSASNYPPAFSCNPYCQAKFTAYFNDKGGTNYTFSQIDSIYTAAGLVLDICGLDTATIRCDQLEQYVDEYKSQLGQPASGYVDMDMRTFAGNKTPDEGPKGVFDVKGKLLGNTVDSTPTAVKQSYVQIWNGSADNREVGTLSLLETGKFRLTLNPGKQAPKEGIVGQRYYQFDTPNDYIDAIRASRSSYIDFGDSSYIKIDSAIVQDSTEVTSFFYVKHTFNNAALRTVTVYHTDLKGILGFDNAGSTAASIANLKNMRGYAPEELWYLAFHSTQDSSLNTFNGFRNKDNISSILKIQFGSGDGVFPFLNYNFGQLSNNHNLKRVWTAGNTTAPKLNNILPDLKNNCPSIEFLLIRGNEYSDSLDLALPNIKYLDIQYGLTTAQVDRILMQLAPAVTRDSVLIYLISGNQPRSSASDSAVALLKSKGAFIHTNGNDDPVNVGPTYLDYNLRFDPLKYLDFTLPVSTPFTDFINSKFNSNLTAAQVDSLYLAKCGHKPNWYTQPDTSFPAGLLLCGKNEPVSPTLSYEEVYDPPCSDSSTLAFNSGTEIFTMYKDSLNNIFDSLYTAKCLGAAALEQFTVKRNVSEYHYTLYYYDQAGNLVKTVAPAGVNPNRASAWLTEVAEKRKLGQTQVPAHAMPTLYRYNSLNQVVSQKTPDAGKSSNWYDRLGRLAISQNAQQKLDGKYSYTRYDVLGRITEVGQKPQSAAMTNIISRDTAALANWLFYNNNGANGAEMVTQTVYDQPGIDATACIAELRFTQKPYTLRNRVSYTRYYEKPAYYNGGDGRYYISGQSYATGVDYSYDIHGNVDTMRNLYGALQYGPMANHGYNACKTIAYTYDLISGKVNEVHYNPGQNDEFYHRYEYDAENRLTDVYTADNKIFLHQQELEEHDAFYRYYRHGPLARTVLSQIQVQGLDYNYTLQGWLKGINASAVRPAYDPGLDGGGSSNSPNRYVGSDNFGLTLNYFRGDYTPINTTADPYPDHVPYMPADRQYNALYNGNISSMMFSMPLHYYPHLYNYKYDQLNRLVSMDVSRNFSSDENHWQNMVSTDLHMEKYSYDGNGNIKTVLRNGNLSANPLMDSLTYFYTEGTNRLDHIRDQYNESTAHNNNYIPRIDLKDQAAGSYTYDAIGNLKSSAWMGDDDIKWNVYGKVVEVEKRALSGVNSRFIHYYYDPSGNKTGEAVRYGSASPYYNHRWYVRDAQGNVLATYEVNNAANASAGTLNLSEHHFYGSSRLGIVKRSQDMDEPKVSAVQEDNLGDTYLLNFTRGNKLFEVTNHLGNVVMVLADLREGLPNISNPSLVRVYRSVIVYSSDYTPFGRTMVGRTSSLSSNYRYGFNGKEYDNEVQAAGNLLDYGNRLYDPMVGRFWSVDPITSKYPMLTPYQFASNRPIDGVDLDGLEWFKRDNTSYRIEYQTVSNANNILDGANRVSHNTLAFIWNLTLGAVGETGKSVNNYFAGGYKERSTTPMEAFEGANHYFAETPLKQQAKDFKQAATDLTTYEAPAQFIVGTRLFGMTFKPKISIGSKEAFEYLYRVQGGGSKLRFIYDEAKNSLNISGDDMLFINIGQEGRAMDFLAKRGDEAVILKIKVNKSFTDKLRKDAVPQNQGRLHPGKPQMVDPTKAPDQFGVPKEYFDDLLKNIDQNSIEVVTTPKK